MNTKFLICNAAIGALFVNGAAFAKTYSGDIYWTTESNLTPFDQKTTYSAVEDGGLVKISDEDSIDWENATLILDAQKTGGGVNAMLAPKKRLAVKNLVIEDTWNNAQGKDQYFWFAESLSGMPIVISDTLTIKSSTSGRVNGSFGIRTGNVLLENANDRHVRIALGGDAAFQGTSGLSYLKVDGDMTIKGNIALITGFNFAVGTKNPQSAEKPAIEIDGKVNMSPFGTNPLPSWEIQWLNARVTDGVARQYVKLGGLNGCGNLAISKTGVNENAQVSYIFTNPQKSVSDFAGKIIYYGTTPDNAFINMIMDGEGEQILRVKNKYESTWRGSVTVNKGVFRLALPQGGNLKVDVVLNAGRFGATGAEGEAAGTAFVNSLKWNGGAIYSKDTSGLVSRVFVEEPVEISGAAPLIFAVDTKDNLEGKWIGAMLEWGSWNDAANREAFEKAANEKRIKLFINSKEYNIDRINLNDFELNIRAGSAK